MCLLNNSYRVTTEILPKGAYLYWWTVAASAAVRKKVLNHRGPVMITNKVLGKAPNVEEGLIC